MRTRLKTAINALLRPSGLKLDGTTGDIAEAWRLARLQGRGHFDEPCFPLPPSFEHADVSALLTDVNRFRDRTDRFRAAHLNDVGYTYDNDYFLSPDAEVFYALVRSRRPRLILEVGCGNSTRVARQAILDGALGTRLVCIDPTPRRDVANIADEVHACRAEEVTEPFERLREGDFLFIDSSHRADVGGDVEYLYGAVLPALPEGVFIHIHDVFLPYQYPVDWVVTHRYGFNEQLLVQVLLTSGTGYEVVWPGHYVYRARPDVPDHFPFATRPPQSLWLRKRGAVLAAPAPPLALPLASA